MKRINLFAAGLVLSIGLLFTSCLNNNGSPVYSGAGLVTLSGYLGTYYFELDNGVKLYPTNVSVWTGISDRGNRFWLTYQLDETEDKIAAEQQKPASSQSYSVVLTYEPLPMESSVNVVSKESANDTLKVNPIVKIIESSNANGFLDLYVSYYFYNNLHSFVLFRYRDEGLREAQSASAPDTLDVYLSHDILHDNNLNYNAEKSDNTVYSIKSFKVAAVLDNLYSPKDSIVFNIKGIQNSNIVEEGGVEYNFKAKVANTYY